MTEIQQMVENVWMSPQVIDYHVFYEMLQSDKKEVGPDRHDVAHPTPTRAAFEKYMSDMGVNPAMTNELAIQTHIIDGKSIPLFLQ